MSIITIEKWNNTTGACSVAIISIFYMLLVSKVIIFLVKNVLGDS